VGCVWVRRCVCVCVCAWGVSRWEGNGKWEGEGCEWKGKCVCEGKLEDGGRV